MTETRVVLAIMLALIGFCWAMGEWQDYQFTRVVQREIDAASRD